MRTIWKYELQLDAQPTIIAMPEGARVLTVQVQGSDAVQLWAEVLDTRPNSLRAFAVFGTGHEIPNNILEYVGTFQLFNGSFVGHVYEMASL